MSEVSQSKVVDDGKMIDKGSVVEGMAAQGRCLKATGNKAMPMLNKKQRWRAPIEIGSMTGGKIQRVLLSARAMFRQKLTIQ